MDNLKSQIDSVEIISAFFIVIHFRFNYKIQGKSNWLDKIDGHKRSHQVSKKNNNLIIKLLMVTFFSQMYPDFPHRFLV